MCTYSDLVVEQQKLTHCNYTPKERELFGVALKTCWGAQLISLWVEGQLALLHGDKAAATFGKSGDILWMDLFLGGLGHHGFRLKLLITTIISAHLVFTGFMLSAQLGSLVFMLPYVWYWIMSAVTCGQHYYFSTLQKNVWKLRAAEWLSWRYTTPWWGVSCSIPAGPLPWVVLASPLVLMIC